VAQTTVAPIVYLSQIHRSANNLTISGSIGQSQRVFTIDTGASHSIIRRDLVSHDDVTPLPGVKLRTATGQDAAVAGKVVLGVGIGNSVINHEFIVANIVDEIIIGMDFMVTHGFILDMKNKTMRFNNADIELNVGYSHENVVRTIRVTSDQKLPPNSESVIWIGNEEINGVNRLYIVEPENTIKDVMVGKTLINLDGCDKFPVRVLNLSNNARVLKKGTPIARCFNVEAVINCDVRSVGASSENLQTVDIGSMEKEFSNRVNKEERKKALELLQKYAALFCTDESRKGKTSAVKHQINTGDAKPIRQPPRSIPLAKRDEVNVLIKEMERNSVIEPSSSPWSSPVVLVKKKDGTTRFCVDYRKLNDVTKKDSYPLPRIDDTLDTLSGSKWFSTLDLKSGYWQVDIDDADREKTAFSVGNGLWQFTVMPFGLCNAPATFERLMERVLSGLHWKTCLVYLDDIIVIGKTFEKHLANLEQVFQRISAAGLKLNPKKCSFLQSEVKYLGHKVSENGIQTDEEKIAAVKTWPRPKDLSELRSFLGLCTYYRRFVPGFATVAGPLHELSRKNQPFKWLEQQEIAFQKLKTLLCSAPVLAYPVPGKMFILDTDASNTGLGGVLSQNIDGQEKVIAYYSRSLGHAERNYCVTRRELLAALECTKHFHKYLYGQQFKLRTDHAALKWLLQFKNPEGQLARWIERLQSYDVMIEHRKGGLHNNADALSRRPCSIECKHCSKAETKEGIIDIRLISINSSERWSSELLQQEQERDPDLRKIVEAMRSGQRPNKQEISGESATTKAYWAQWQSLKLHDGCLHRVWESEDGKSNRDLLVIPKCRVNEVLTEFHNGASGGHLGINKTFDKIRTRFYWIGCRQSISDWVQSCQVCMQAKGPNRKSRGRMMLYNSGAPFERIAMDIAGPFPVSSSGNRYVLVVMDYFSKWPEVYAIPNQEAKTVADVFVKNWVCRFGVPIELHSDQGRNFESAIFGEMCLALGINKTRTTPLHPQSDGMVERFNRTLEEHLRKVVSKEQKDWDKHLPAFLMAYRSAVHDTTSHTPAKILFGTDLRLPADLEFGMKPSVDKDVNSYGQQIREELDEIHRAVRLHTHLKSDKMKMRFDGAANCDGFNEGDLVLLYNPQRKKGLSPKLQSNWEGPYRVVKRINDVVYRIQSASSHQRKMKVVHLERLAKYVNRVCDDDRDDQA